MTTYQEEQRRDFCIKKEVILLHLVFEILLTLGLYVYRKLHLKFSFINSLIKLIFMYSIKPFPVIQFNFYATDFIVQ